MTLLDILMRWAHLTAASVVLGGMVMLLAGVPRGLKILEGGLAETALDAVERVSRRWIWPAVVVLIVTGVWTWIRLAPAYDGVGPIANILIGVKVLVAFGAFGVIWARTTGLITQPRTYAVAVLSLVLVVTALASWLRHIRLAHLVATGSP